MLTTHNNIPVDYKYKYSKYKTKYCELKNNQFGGGEILLHSGQNYDASAGKFSNMKLFKNNGDYYWKLQIGSFNPQLLFDNRTYATLLPKNKFKVDVYADIKYTSDIVGKESHHQMYYPETGKAPGWVNKINELFGHPKLIEADRVVIDSLTAKINYVKPNIQTLISLKISISKLFDEINITILLQKYPNIFKKIQHTTESLPNNIEQFNELSENSNITDINSKVISIQSAIELLITTLTDWVATSPSFWRVGKKKRQDIYDANLKDVQEIILKLRNILELTTNMNSLLESYMNQIETMDKSGESLNVKFKVMEELDKTEAERAAVEIVEAAEKKAIVEALEKEAAERKAAAAKRKAEAAAAEAEKKAAVDAIQPHIPTLKIKLKNKQFTELTDEERQALNYLRETTKSFTWDFTTLNLKDENNQNTISTHVNLQNFLKFTSIDTSQNEYYNIITGKPVIHSGFDYSEFERWK